MLNRRGWRPHQVGKTCQTPSKKPWKSAEKAYLGLGASLRAKLERKSSWNRHLVGRQTEKANSPASVHSRLLFQLLVHGKLIFFAALFLEAKQKQFP